MKITEKQKKALREDLSYGDWEVVEDDIHLHMDNHGCNVKLCVIRSCKEADKLYGFTYEESSEETFYDGDDTVFEVEKVVKTTYQPKNYD